MKQNSACLTEGVNQANTMEALDGLKEMSQLLKANMQAPCASILWQYLGICRRPSDVPPGCFLGWMENVNETHSKRQYEYSLPLCKGN